MKKRIISLLLVTTMVGAMLIGCGSSKTSWVDGDGKIDGDLTFWTQDSGPWREYFDAATDRFREKYPDVNLKVEYFADFKDKASQAFAAGEEPDVFQTWQSITEWAKAGKIVEIPDEVMSKEYLEENYYESALQNKIHDGKYYGIPSEISVESPTLYVNMDILKEEGIELPQSWIDNNGPATFKELYEFADKLTVKESDGSVKRSGLAYCYSQWEANFLSLILQHGGDYKDPANNKVKFDTPEARKAVETLLKYCEGPEAVSDTGDLRFALFEKNTAAMCVGAPWYSGAFAIEVPDLNWQVFNMPAWVEGAKPISIGTGGWAYSVSERSKNKEAAWAFVEFFTSAEETGTWAYQTGALSARKDALTELEYDPNVGSVEKALSIAQDILPYAVEDGAYMQTPSTLTYTIVREKLRQLLVDKDVDAALKAMEDEGNTMIEENLAR